MVKIKRSCQLLSKTKGRDHDLITPLCFLDINFELFQIKSIQIHHLSPGIDEILDEYLS